MYRIYFIQHLLYLNAEKIYLEFGATLKWDHMNI